MPPRDGVSEKEGLLWQALCRRDGAAYEELAALVDRLAAPVFRRSGAAPETVETLVQDVLVSIFEYACRGGPAPGNLAAFLYWRARGVWTDWLRSERARKAALADLAAHSIDGAPALDALVLDELDRALRDCRAALDEKYRRAWEARYEDGRTSEEIADQLGIERAQVAVRLHRARKALEECLRRRGLLE